MPNPSNIRWVGGGGIAAIARDAYTTESFTVGTDGRVWMAGGWNANVGWPNPYPLNMPASSFTPGTQLTAVTRAPGMVDIYVVDAQGALWNAGYSPQNGAGWAAPYQVGATGLWHGGVAAAARSPKYVDVYAIGNDGATWDAASWIGPPTFNETEKVCQLTGDEDWGTPGTAGALTGMVRGGGSLGVTGTDIGWSFEHQGRLNFMFGDTRDFDKLTWRIPDSWMPGGQMEAVGSRAIRIGLTGRRYHQRCAGATRALTRTGSTRTATRPRAGLRSPPVPIPSLCLDFQVPDDGAGSYRRTLLNGRIMLRQEGAFSGFSDGTNMFAFVTQKAWPVDARRRMSPGARTTTSFSRWREDRVGHLS